MKRHAGLISDDWIFLASFCLRASVPIFVLGLCEEADQAFVILSLFRNSYL